MSRRTQTWLLGAAIAMAVLARLWHLSAVCLDGDEIFSVQAGRLDWRAITAAAAADSVHPPLFYYLLNVWMQIGGESLTWLRLLPVSLSIIAIPPFILLCRELRLRSVEIIAAVAALAVHPYLIYYAQHVRMYSLLMVFGVASMWLFAKLPADRTRYTLVALTLVNVALVYSHYYGCLLVAIEFGYALIWVRSRVWQVLLSSAIVLIALTPWLWIAANAVRAKGGLASNLDWIQRPRLTAFVWFFIDLAGCAEYPVFGAFLASAMFVLLVAAVVSGTDGARLSRPFLTVFTFAPVVLAFSASWILPQSVWGHRHLVFVAVPFLALASMLYCRSASRRVMRVCVSVLAAAWAVQAFVHVAGVDDKKLPWDRFVLEVLAREEATTSPIPFYSVDPYVHYPVSFYLDGWKTHSLAGFSMEPPARLEASLIEVRRAATFDELSGRHFWAAYSPHSGTPAQPERLFINRGCTAGSRVSAKDRFHEVIAFPVWCGRVE